MTEIVIVEGRGQESTTQFLSLHLPLSRSLIWPIKEKQLCHIVLLDIIAQARVQPLEALKQSSADPPPLLLQQAHPQGYPGNEVTQILCNTPRNLLL